MGKTNSFGFGERLRAARKLRGLSGEELGRGAGESGKDASKASVSDWEHERHYPKADQLRVICLKLNVAVDDLIFGDVKEHLQLIQAKSAIQALTEEQRRSLLVMMMGDTAPDSRVGEFIQPAPAHPLDSRPAPLEQTKKEGAMRSLLKNRKLSNPLSKKAPAKTAKQKER